MARNTSIYIRIALITGLCYLLGVALFSRTAADVDLWGYLSFGRVFWEDGYFPFRDLFAYTPTNPVWVYHEWLTGVVFYPVLKYSGAAGLQFFRYLMILFTLYLIYLTALKKGGSPTSALVSLIPATLLISYGYATVVRAQVFTYFFFILTIFIIENARNNRKWIVLLWLLPVQILWCNFHGGYIAGLGLIGLYALGDALSRKKFIPLVGILCLATVATLVNPYGIGYWKFIVQAATMPRPEIDEWMSAVSALKSGYQLIPVVTFVLLSLICLASFVLYRRRYLTEIVILAAIIYLGLQHVRHTIFLAILFAAFFPLILSELQNFYLQKKPALSLSFLPLIFLAVFFLSTQWIIHRSMQVSIAPSFAITAPQSYYPINALEYMKENHIQGRILPFFGWGEFLIWSCYPDCKVAMDGRYETVYSEGVYKEYFDFLLGRKGWERFLTAYPHDLILIQPNTRLSSLMSQHPAWKNVYTDSTSVVFIRNVGLEKQKR